MLSIQRNQTSVLGNELKAGFKGEKPLDTPLVAPKPEFCKGKYVHTYKPERTGITSSIKATKSKESSRCRLGNKMTAATNTDAGNSTDDWMVFYEADLEMYCLGTCHSESGVRTHVHLSNNGDFNDRELRQVAAAALYFETASNSSSDFLE